MFEQTIRDNIDNLDIRLAEIPEVGDLKLVQMAAFVSWSCHFMADDAYQQGLKDGVNAVMLVQRIAGNSEESGDASE